MLTPVPQVQGPRIYCGPTAISSVTGVHPHEVYSTICRLRGDPDHDRPIVGMSDFEVCNVLGFLGFATYVREIEAIPPMKRTRVRTFFGEREDGAPAIVSTSNHYLVTDGVDALCNQTQGKPVPLPCHPYYNAYMRRIIQVARRIP